LSVMSHELRTPLNVVMGFTGIIRDRSLGDVNADQDRALAKIQAQSNILLQMIASILKATTIEAGEVAVERETLDLGVFLENLRTGFARRAREDLTLDWKVPDRLPRFQTDGEKLRAILDSLLDNAFKFTPRGTVTFSVAPMDGAGRIEFKVSDTGIGIEKDALPIIFKMFRQADGSETRKHGGIGLGLYIAKNLATLLGGELEVESEPGVGSTFTVRIPAIV